MFCEDKQTFDQVSFCGDDTRGGIGASQSEIGECVGSYLLDILSASFTLLRLCNAWIYLLCLSILMAKGPEIAKTEKSSKINEQ